MKLLAALTLLFLAFLLAAALLNHPARDVGVNAASRDLHGEGRPRPAPRRDVPAPASRSRHTEPPSRLDRLDWKALATCESGNNPRAVSPSGRYRGLFQF